MKDWITAIAEPPKNLVISPWIISKIDSTLPSLSSGFHGETLAAGNGIGALCGENRRSLAGRQGAPAP